MSTPACMDMLRDCVNLLVKFIWPYIQLIFRLVVKPPLKSLDDDIILITGAGNGIGKEMCLYLGQSCPKTTLVCWDINWRDNEVTVGTLKAMGVRAFGYKVDISDRDQVTKCAVQVREEVGDPTVVINNAGILHRPVNFLKLSPTEIERTFNVNTMAHCWTLREFLPKMVERNSGHVVTICSVAGNFGNPKFSIYCASKCALRGLIESISVELQAQNIDINFTTVFPGLINTQMVANTDIRNRTSLPYLMRTLEPKEVGKEIIDSFRRNEEHVYLPRYSSRIAVFILNMLLPKSGNAIKLLYTYEPRDR